MGWAKYCEDNIEIMMERQFMVQKSEVDVVRRTNNCLATNLILNIVETSVEASKTKYEDKYIMCKDCGKKFLFSAKTQKYFEKMNWDEPKRCKCCRSYRNTRYLMCSSF